jgi:hypothetical protein
LIQGQIKWLLNESTYKLSPVTLLNF